MRTRLTVAPTGPSEWTVYRGTDWWDRVCTIRCHAGYASVERDEGELPYGSEAPEWTALFWSFEDAVTAALLYGADLWHRIDPTPSVARGTNPGGTSDTN